MKKIELFGTEMSSKMVKIALKEELEEETMEKFAEFRREVLVMRYDSNKNKTAKIKNKNKNRSRERISKAMSSIIIMFYLVVSNIPIWFD